MQQYTLMHPRPGQEPKYEGSEPKNRWLCPISILKTHGGVTMDLLLEAWLQDQVHECCSATHKSEKWLTNPGMKLPGISHTVQYFHLCCCEFSHAVYDSLLGEQKVPSTLPILPLRDWQLEANQSQVCCQDTTYCISHTQSRTLFDSPCYVSLTCKPVILFLFRHICSVNSFNPIVDCCFIFIYIVALILACVCSVCTAGKTRDWGGKEKIKEKQRCSTETYADYTSLALKSFNLAAVIDFHLIRQNGSNFNFETFCKACNRDRLLVIVLCMY